MHSIRFAAVLLMLALAGGVRAQPTTVRLEGDAIVFSGRIDGRSVADFLALAQDPQVARLVITSAGGLVSPALDMAEAIHQRGLAVEVPETCLSSCANYIFPAGRRKVLGWPGAVGWHGNITHVLHLHRSGRGRWSEREIASARVLAQREAQFFRRIGVDGFVCWFGKIAPYQVQDFYWLSPRDMARFGIRDVTVREIAPRSQHRDRRPVVVDWMLLQATRPAAAVQ